MAGDRAITFNHPWLNTKRKYMLCALACFVLVSSVFKMSHSSVTAADNAELAYDRGYIVERGWACDSQSGAMMHLSTHNGAPGCVQIKEAVEIIILESRSPVYLVRTTRNSYTWWITLNDLAR